MSQTPQPEIVIGLVGPVGAPLEEVQHALSGALNQVGYRALPVRVSRLLGNLRGGLPELDELDHSNEYHRLRTHMAAGTAVRRAVGRADAMAALAMGEIAALRGESSEAQASVAYVVRSLKNPAEVVTLRRVYGPHFSLLGVHANRRTRMAKLTERLAASDGSMKHDRSRAWAEELIALDEKEPGDRYGQNEQDTYPLADYFVDASNLSRLDSQLQRFVRILFAHPFETPSKLECGMFHAWGAAMRSAALGRQVGAALTTVDGDLRAVGTNEVPKAGGGHYWADDPGDAREFRQGRDQNIQAQQVLARQILSQLANAGWLSADHSQRAGSNLEGLVREAMRAKSDHEPEGPLRATWLASLTEFVREVYAELSALLTAARRGVAVDGSDLFTTTFPCHNCAKHIVAAGIGRVFYIEPYPKSFAAELHLDAIETENPDSQGGGRVPFLPYVGVAPSRFATWFARTSAHRKDGDGVVRPWDAARALPWFERVDPGYLMREKSELVEVQTAILERGITMASAEEEQ